MDSADMAHTSTGWQFEKLKIMPDIMEMGAPGKVDGSSSGDQRGFTNVTDIDWITENANFAAENFTSDRHAAMGLHRQPSITSTSSNIIRHDLPSHQIDDAFEMDDPADVVVRRRYDASNKKNRLATLRMRKAVMSQARDNIDQTDVIDVLARDPELNQQSPESEQLRMEAIRDLHYSLSMKRSLKRQMSQVVVRKPMQRQRLGALMRFKMKQGFRSFKMKLKEGLRMVDFWRAHIHKVEGRFGSSTAYYFRFLQQLVALNLLIFIISCAFILAPHELNGIKENNPTDNQTSMRQNHTSVQENLTRTQENLESMQDNKTSVHETHESTFSLSDILTGSGYLNETVLYYGAYSNASTEVIGLPYSFPLAYLLATASHLLLCLFLLASWVADAYKKYLAANSSYGAHTFCNLVFSSWDFTIMSHEACKLKRMCILHDLQEKVERYNCKTGNQIGCSAKCEKFMRRFLNHVVAFATLIVCGYLTWYLLKKNGFKTRIPVLAKMTVSLVITGFFIVLPLAYSIIVTWEGYRARCTEVYATLVRMMLLLMTVLGVLCYVRFGIDYEYVHNNDVYGGRDILAQCWETSMGEEVYRLLIVDFLISTLLYLLVSYLQRYFTLPKWLGSSEFNLAWNTWNLIYTQILCWLGSLYSPLISGLVLVKLILTFYLKQIHVRQNCTPPTKPWGATQAKTIFLLITFLGLIATLILVGYSIFAILPSKECGPFRGKETAYDVVIDELNKFNVEHTWLAGLIFFVTRPGCVAAIIVILCAIAFQTKAFAETNKDMVKRLQEQLMLEGTDKNFLLQMVDKATLMQPKGDGPTPSSATQLPSNRRTIRQAGSSSPPSATTNGRPMASIKAHSQGTSRSPKQRTNGKINYESLHRDSAQDRQYRRPSAVPEERLPNRSNSVQTQN